MVLLHVLFCRLTETVNQWENTHGGLNGLHAPPYASLNAIKLALNLEQNNVKSQKSVKTPCKLKHEAADDALPHQNQTLTIIRQPGTQMPSLS